MLPNVEAAKLWDSEQNRDVCLRAVCPTDLGYTNNIIQQRKQIYDKQIYMYAKHNIYFSIHTHNGWAQAFWQKKI